jgi:lysozyme family protein
MADFLTAVTKTLEYEGGLVDNPADPGGLTNFGIALKFHPELTADDIRAMTRTRAIGIYRQQYWPDIYTQIQSQAVANCLFDFGVTSGPATAVQTIQGILFLRGHGSQDGAFGPATLAAVNRQAEEALVKEFTVERLRFYVGLNRPDDLHAWFSRAIDALMV